MRAPLFPPTSLRALGMFPASRPDEAESAETWPKHNRADETRPDETRRDETRRGRRRGTAQRAASCTTSARRPLPLTPLQHPPNGAWRRSTFRHQISRIFRPRP